MIVNRKSVLYLAFLFTLVSVAVVSFGCAVNVGNGDQTANRKGDDIIAPCTLTGNTCELGTFKGLEAKIELQILIDWYNRTGLNRALPDLSDLFSKGVCIHRYVGAISEYCGTYNDYFVVEIYILNYTRPVIESITIGKDGYILQDPSYRTWAWKKGQFYSLEGLHRQGELTLTDMRIIASHHHRFIRGRYR